MASMEYKKPQFVEQPTEKETLAANKNLKMVYGNGPKSGHPECTSKTSKKLLNG